MRRLFYAETTDTQAPWEIYSRVELDCQLSELLELSLGKPRGLGIQHRRAGQGTRLHLFPFQFLQEGVPGLMGAAAHSLWVLLSFPSFLAAWSMNTCTHGWMFPTFPYFPSCWIVYFLHELAFFLFSVNIFLHWRLVFHRDLELKKRENLCCAHQDKGPHLSGVCGPRLLSQLDILAS